MDRQKKEKEDKFILLYDRYIDEIYQFIYLRTGLNSSVTEDLTQDIFLNVYRSMSGFKGLCSQRTWIYNIAKNRLSDFYRKQYRSSFDTVEFTDYLAQSLEDPNQDISALLQQTLTKEKVRTCLLALPKQYRITLTLKYINGNTVKEIAAMVGKSPKSVESLLQRAKKAFSKHYQDQEKEEI